MMMIMDRPVAFLENMKRVQELITLFKEYLDESGNM